VRDTRLAELRSRVALVTQDVQLFTGTLRDNVTVFDPDVDDANVRGVFASLGLDQWLAELPAGLDTVLGAGSPRNSARGLSAGEAQLVALARVFLKDPSLVVLDEPSSRLDPRTEALVESAIAALLAGRTAVIVAHRLTTVERADSILILERGRVVELGRRVELARDPASRYSQLLRIARSTDEVFV
jgi:ABC-type multidrug transport system fused ATPase/permease subunit